MYISMTAGWSHKKKIRLAVKIVFAAFTVSMVLLFFGNWVFKSFGITLDAFRIGGGALLFLTAVGLVNRVPSEANIDDQEGADIAVVPLAIPVTIGPGTTAAILIMGAETANPSEQILSCLSLTAALICLGAILLAAPWLERIFGQRGITILSKLTGLILASLAAQMICTGIAGFFPALTKI